MTPLAPGAVVGLHPAVLLIAEPDPAEARRAESSLREALGPEVRIRWMASMRDAGETMADPELDVVLVNPGGGDGWAAERLREARGAPSLLPVIVSGNEAPGDLNRSVRHALEQVRAIRMLQRGEQRFRALAENITETLVIISSNGEIEYASQSLEDLVGIEAGALLGQDPFDAILPEDRKKARAALGMVAEGTHPPGPIQFRVRLPDGGIRTIEASGENLLEDPVVSGIIVSLRDVSHRVILEERLRDSQKLEAVGRLAGGIAHDFNNILTALAGNTDLLLGELEGKETGRVELEEMREGIQRASELTSRLLAFSRRQILVPRVLDLGAALRGMEGLLRRVLRSNVDLEIEVEESGAVWADLGQVEQVIMNLAVNGSDAMLAGGTLRMIVERSVVTHGMAGGELPPVPSGDYIRLTVSDSGEGMDADTLSRAFEPFFTTKPAGTGTGLGLAMVYGVVRQSGGHIRADSEPGRGASFRTYLPRVESTPGAAASEMSSESSE